MELPSSRPSEVAEAAARVLEAMSSDEKRQLAETEKDDLIRFHFGLGTAIRNQFGLWAGNAELLRDCDRVSDRRILGPDGAASVIIEKAWRQARKSQD